MLTQLTIKDFAIIDDITIEFEDGFTILTGETGAGKSIIIDAVNLLSGARSSVDYVRFGAKKAEISGLFHIRSSDLSLLSYLKSLDIIVEEEMLIIERQIMSNGKSICKVNSKLVTLGALKQIGEHIITIHSQHDTLSLMDEKKHMSLLDKFNEKINELKITYRTAFEKLKNLQSKYTALVKNEKELNHRVDLLKFQLSEIETAELKIDEDDCLEEEKQQLQNYEKIYHTVHSAYNLFHQDGQLYEKLNILKDNLQATDDIDKALSDLSEDTTNAFYQLEDVMFRLRDYRDALFFDEDRLNEIEARLHEINRLKKKYGESIELIHSYYAEISQELNELVNKDSFIESLADDIKIQKVETEKLAKSLHEKRYETSLQLKQIIQKELKSLYIKDAIFDISIEKQANLTIHGMDEVTFLIATNKGEPLKPLSKVASGGELSRVMLAMLKVLIKHTGVDTVIFDEIDTGVSGRVAQAIAQKMNEIAQKTQVLGITHLPQVAATAQQQLLISKHAEKERTATKVTHLNASQRIKEIAKMITGEEITSTAEEHAATLIQQSQHSIKKQ